jgi:hypothetical protein
MEREQRGDRSLADRTMPPVISGGFSHWYNAYVRGGKNGGKEVGKWEGVDRRENTRAQIDTGMVHISEDKHAPVRAR